MFVYRRRRRRLQRHVGPGHGRRRAFGMPDHEYGRDTEVADMGRDTMRRDFATGDTARDPATGHTARDDHPPRRVRQPAIRHGTIISYPTMSGCPVMSDYTLARVKAEHFTKCCFTALLREKVTLWEWPRMSRVKYSKSFSHSRRAIYFGAFFHPCVITSASVQNHCSPY